MNIGKAYLNLTTNKLDDLEKSYDFIPHMTNEAAIAKSLNAVCYHKTLEIAKLKSKQKMTNIHEMSLAEIRNYAVKHLK